MLETTEILARLNEHDYGYECPRCGNRARERLEFCWRCQYIGPLIPRTWRPHDDIIPRPAGLSARALAALDQKMFVIPAYPTLKLGPGSLVTVTGGPGAGKSTFALRVAQCLR